MNMHRLVLASLLFLTVFFPFRSSASEFFKNGSCAIIVAARQSVSETREWIIANDWEGSARVYLSENGWYAIAIGQVRTEAAEQRLAAGKESGLYPNDSYCSSGRLFVREVAWARADSPTVTATSTGLWGEFDARPLTRSEKAFLQASLALQGEYKGLLDGVWGDVSQRALERYTLRSFDREPSNADAAYLSMLLFEAIEEAGWRRHVVDNLAISIVLPLKELTLKESDGAFEKWEHNTKNITLIFNDFETSDMISWHNELSNNPDLTESPYLARKAELWVTSGRLENGSFYARSDLILGTWSTSIVFAGAHQDGELALITSSIKPNEVGLFLPEQTGLLTSYTEALVELLKQTKEEQANKPYRSVEPPSPNQRKSEEISTGTGFLVTREGVYLTNAHVVDGCNSVTVGGDAAEIIAVSKSFDLAALQSSVDNLGSPLAFSRTEAGLNSDVTIAGFPLYGLLGGLNVSRGSVSALKGIGGDETTVQISAPVQPGNSGGPMIDRYGNVVGVVVAKLDAVEVANVTGDIAQNVNFAIRGSIAKIFLQTNGIEYSLGANERSIVPENAARLLQSATKLVECGSQ